MNKLINKDNEWIIHFMGSLGWRAFLYRQGGVGTVEGEPPDTSGLP